MIDQHLELLRNYLKSNQVDYFLLPREDRFQGEYVAPSEERLAWLTGFTGSAGVCLIGLERAVLFVDGRYTVQAAQQTDKANFTVQHLIDDPPIKWLRNQVQAEEVIAVDPWYISPRLAAELESLCVERRARLLFLDENPIDQLWTDRPNEPESRVVSHGLEFSGRRCVQKLADLRRAMKKTTCTAKVISDPACVAWLFNIRAQDLAFTPVALAYAVVTERKAVLLIKQARLDSAVFDSFPDDVECVDPIRLPEVLRALAGQEVAVDQATVPAQICRMIKAVDGVPRLQAESIALWKACKNEVELQGMRNAHVRDGVAICRFIYWLKTARVAGVVDEYTAACRMAEFRKDLDSYMGPSYVPISAAGPHAAMCHYQPSASGAKILQQGDIFLLDSGGQYLDGTTDFTRTFIIGGSPSERQRFHYTLVLKAHIALATLKFPVGTTGRALDAVARVPLWRRGMDYDHGTGHGVGSYLSVHEGPQRIAKIGSDIALAPGMILSIEPGYYIEGQYGIRFENLVEVVKDESVENEGPFLTFKPLTLAPIEMALVDVALLDSHEKAWVNAYHLQLLTVLAELLETDLKKFLRQELRKII